MQQHEPISINPAELENDLQAGIDAALLRIVEEADVTGDWSGYGTEDDLIRNLEIITHVRVGIRQADGSLNETSHEFTTRARNSFLPRRRLWGLEWVRLR